jgi:hypothetical protein
MDSRSAAGRWISDPADRGSRAKPLSAVLPACFLPVSGGKEGFGAARGV